jgi:hypothetical protein
MVYGENDQNENIEAIREHWSIRCNDITFGNIDLIDDLMDVLDDVRIELRPNNWRIISLRKTMNSMNILKL